MKKLYSILILSLITTKSFCCICPMQADYKSQDDLKEYDYIAHVKIIGVESIEGDHDKHNMDVITLELIKGKRVEKLFVHYENGNLELEEHYLNGKIEGLRKVFYPEGGIRTIQYFRKDKKHGEFLAYSKSGILRSKEKFYKGIAVDTSTYWNEIFTNYYVFKEYAKKNNISMDQAKELYPKSQKPSMIIYNKKGRELYHVYFSSDGKLDSETFYSSKGKEITKRYFPNGQLRYYSESNNRNYRSFDKEWDIRGNLYSIKEFDKNGKLIGGYTGT